MGQKGDRHNGAGKVWEGWGGARGNVGHCKRAMTCERGGRGRDGLVSSETWHIAKRGLTSWRGGRGRSRLVSSETWHIAKRGLTSWRGGRGETSWRSWKKGKLEKGVRFMEGRKREEEDGELGKEGRSKKRTH